MKDTGMILGAFFLGALIGVSAGILLAPDKGSDTRKKLASSTKGLASKIRSKMRNGKLAEFEDEYETILGL